jgi:hypothetical protein
MNTLFKVEAMMSKASKKDLETCYFTMIKIRGSAFWMIKKFYDVNPLLCPKRNNNMRESAS